MNFMESVTLVKMLPKGFKHGARRLGAQRVLHRFMIMAMLLLCSVNAASDGTESSEGGDTSPSFTRSGNYLHLVKWALIAILALIAIIVGFTANFDAGEGVELAKQLGGASQFMQCTIIGVGFAFLATSMFRVAILGNAIHSAARDEQGNYNDESIAKFEKYSKIGKDVTTWMGLVMFAVAVILVFVSLQKDLEGDFLMGKTMTFMSLLGMGAISLCAIKYSYADDTTSALLMTKGKDGVVTAGKNMKKWIKNQVSSMFDGDKKSSARFFLESKTFWVSILCLVALVVALSAGDFSGNSMIMKMSTIIASVTFLTCAVYIGLKRHKVYKQDMEMTQSDWEISKNKKTQHIGNKMICVAFAILALSGVILGIVMLAGGHLAGSGTGALFPVLVLLSVGSYGLFKTYKGFGKNSEGLLAYCNYEGEPKKDDTAELQTPIDGKSIDPKAQHSNTEGSLEAKHEETPKPVGLFSLKSNTPHNLGSREGGSGDMPLPPTPKSGTRRRLSMLEAVFNTNK